MADLAQFATLFVIVGVSLAVIYYDLSMMRIPNALSGILLVTFAAAVAPLMSLDALLWQVGLSATVALLTFVAFYFRTLGGGDVKILTALSLFVPLSALNQVLFVFSFALIASSLAILTGRRLVGPGNSNWAFLKSNKLPMGVGIGLTALSVAAYAIMERVTSSS